MNVFLMSKKTGIVFFAVVLGSCFWLRAGETAATNAPAATPSLDGAVQKPATATNNPPAIDTNKNSTVASEIALPQSSSTTAPGLGELPTAAVIDPPVANTAKTANLQDFQAQLDLGRQQRREKNLPLANRTLSALMQTNAPTEIQRLALFELALTAQDDGQFVKAQQVFSQYIHTYPDDASVPEVLLRQGLIYRQMGVNTLAISKFYAVMSSALKLKLDNMDYYKKLVLQSQMEIADTYYLEGRYEEASDFFGRLAKAASPQLDQMQVQFKLVRSLSFLSNQVDTVAKAQTFLDIYTNSSDVPEVRFVLASALKQLGRNHESMKQVMLLLQSQQENVSKNPETWIYWQQRAGNDIANQLFKDGDFLSALQIYVSLAELNKSPEWQLPVWYQTGLVYEQLRQWTKAKEVYVRIMGRQKELTEATSTPSLQSLCDMAKWRNDYIDWMQKAQLTNQSFQPAPTNAVPSSSPVKE